MIRFPQKHIAENVLERIIRAERQMNSVQNQGMKLDQALAQPVGDVAPIEGVEDMVTMKALQL